MMYLLSVELASAQGDGFFHQHSDREVIGSVEEVANQGDVSALPGSFNHRADGVRTVSLHAYSPHSGMGDGVRAPETTRFDAAIEAVWFN